jgi:aminopeptidase N
MFLLAHDSDPFNRWEAGQRLAAGTILKLIREYREGRELSLSRGFIEAFSGVLSNSELDRAFVAETLSLPSEDYLAELMEVVDVVAIHTVREFVRGTLAFELHAEFLSIYKSLEDTAGYRIDAAAVGGRNLKNLSLSYLMALKEQPVIDLCMEQFRRADNMTDIIGALGPLVQTDCPERAEALSLFHDRWKDDSLVMDKWFSLQATSRLSGTLGEVERLLEHPAFEIRNPNRVRSLIGAFCQSNPLRFHEEDGSGYRFLGEQVARLNDLNPQVAARLMGALSNWRKYDGKRQELMKEQLGKILALPKLAKDVYEIAVKSLNN